MIRNNPSSKMKKTTSKFCYYVTETLKNYNYRHLFPQTVKKSNIPRDAEKSGFCCLISSITMRRILAILHEERYKYHIDSKENSEKELVEKFSDSKDLNKSYPYWAFQQVIGENKKFDINEPNLSSLIQYCKKWPIILPYCSAPSRSASLVKISREEYMNRTYEVAQKIVSQTWDGKFEKDYGLQSLCVAGITSDNDGDYFVCPRTTPESGVALIPIVTNEDFIKKYGMSDASGYCCVLNSYLRHSDTGNVPTITLPREDPINYPFSVPALPKLITMPFTRTL